MATTVTLGPRQTLGDVQADPLTISDDLASIIAIKAGVSKVSLLVTAAAARICMSQTVAQGAARPTTNHIDIPAGGSFDITPARVCRSAATAWQVVVSNTTNGAAPVISPSIEAL